MIPKWLAFCAAYPTPAACAAAAARRRAAAWQGLGYPRRARNLHDAATAMVARHGGAVPDELDALLALPGIGPYTARAVLAFAFERDVAVVDTNIARVLARVAGERLTLRRVQALADDARARRRRVGVEPGADGPRRHGVPAGAALRRLPARRRAARGTSAGQPDPDPAAGSAGVSTPPGAVRGQRPPGPRRRAAGPRRRPRARAATSRPASSPASSPTASSSAPATSSTSPDPTLPPIYRSTVRWSTVRSTATTDRERRRTAAR